MGNLQLSEKRVAKNTIILTIRYVVVMAITLYTSRVVFQQLGVVDYGIYNVIAGLVVLFSFFSSSLSNSVQRFLNYEVGTNNLDNQKKVFLSGLLIFGVSSWLIVLVLELFGPWFIENKMQIPSDRLEVTKLIFHISVIGTFFSLNKCVFTASIMSHEDMNVFAYIGIFEAVARLSIAFVISSVSCDKLVLYTALYCSIEFIIGLFSYLYCSKKYDECKQLKFYFEKPLLASLFKFIGWNIVISGVNALNQQGLNVLFNIFCGPVVNAARGISFQIFNAVQSFSHNLYVATRPQLTKSYASGNMEFFFSLFHKSSKLSFYLLLIICIPLMINIDYILHLWLGEVPEYTNIFSVLVIVFLLIDSLCTPIWAAVQSCGTLKSFSIWGSLTSLMVFPISYCLLQNSFQPFWVLFVYDIVRFIYLIVVVYILANLISEFSVGNFFNKILVPTFLSGLFSYVSCYFVNTLFDLNFVSFTFLSMLYCIITLIIVFVIGLTSNERKHIYQMIKSNINTRCIRS